MSNDTEEVLYPFIAEISATLLPHLISLIAAISAVIGISCQIQSNVDLAERNRKSNLDSARGTLPIVLSNIIEICDERQYVIINGENTDREDKYWKITDFELSTIRDCIKYADGDEKEHMLNIMRVYQVLISRWIDPIYNTREFVNLFSTEKSDSLPQVRDSQYRAILNWLTLRVMCLVFFDYARDASPNFRIQEKIDEMRNRVLNELIYVHGKDGQLLTDIDEYKDFTEQKIKGNFVEFIDTDWQGNTKTPE